MQTFSIIIPLVGHQKKFEDTIGSILRYCPEATQVIVVADTEFVDEHGLSKDGVELIRMDSPNLIDCFNAGVMRATEQVVGFIRPGIELEDCWQAVSDEFGDSSVGTVSPILVSEKKPNSVIATGVEMGMGFTRRLSGNGINLKSIDWHDYNTLGPTSWAGFYRGNLLAHLMKEVDSIDSSLDPHYLDLEIGLCMSTLGFANSLCGDFVATTSKHSAILREAGTSHGCSAQRAFCRHVLHIGTTSNFLQSLTAKLTEIVTSPLATWKLKHAMERSLARRYRDSDEVFSDDVSVAARKLRRLESKPQLKVVHPEEEPEESQLFEAATRNATMMVSEKRRTAMEANQAAPKRRAA